MDFELLCPCCGARLKVDPELKAIIAHEAPKVARKFESVDDAVGALKTHDAEREKKFEASVDAYFSAKQAEKVKTLFAKREQLDSMPVNELMAAMVTNGVR